METLDLSDFFTTKSQAGDFAARLSDIAEKIYEVNFNLETALQDELGVQKKDKFISLLRNNGIPIGSNSDIKNFFKKISDTIVSLPVAELTLATEPDKDTLKKISDWFLINLKKQVLVEINVNPDLIAGAQIRYKGRHLDASIKPVFDETYRLVVTAGKRSAKEVVNTDTNGHSKLNNGHTAVNLV